MIDDGEDIDFAPPKRQEKPDPPWMISFADLISLMVGFFVLMFSMVSIRHESWRQVTEALSHQLSPVGIGSQSPRSNRPGVAPTTLPRAIDLGYLEALLADKMSNDPVLSQATLRQQEGRLVLSLPSDLLFATGSAELTPEALRAAQVLADMLRNLSNQVEVHGHTDPEPISGGAFRSNWQLSLVRAMVVAEGLKRGGYTEDVAAVGHADGRFQDIDPALDLKARYQKARRVEIMIRENSPRGAHD